MTGKAWGVGGEVWSVGREARLLAHRTLRCSHPGSLLATRHSPLPPPPRWMPPQRASTIASLAERNCPAPPPTNFHAPHDRRTCSAAGPVITDGAWGTQFQQQGLERATARSSEHELSGGGVFPARTEPNSVYSMYNITNHKTYKT